MTICGTLVYTAVNSDGSGINTNIFTFDPSSRTLSVFTTDLSFYGNYDIVVTGNVGNYGSMSFHILVTVTKACQYAYF